MDLHRRLIPFFDTSVSRWAMEAQVLRWLTLLWLFIGLAILFSASYGIGDASTDWLYLVKRQLLGIVLGLIAFNIIVHSPLQRILGISHWIVLILLVLIFITTIAGTDANGATRWLPIGTDRTIQPSELIKPFLVLQSAKIFGRWHKLRWKTRLSWLLIFALVLLGILIQPNLSTTALCGMTLWLIALAAGLSYFALGGTALLGILLAVASIRENAYQLSRITSFLNPWADPMGDGFQLKQSLLAIGSGGVNGTGFGLSQQKLSYLPYQHTDFIFAVFAEEFGFIGCLLFLLLIVVFATVSLLIALKTKNVVHRLVAIGAMVLIVGQSMLNIGVATGVLPTTGLPLPFVSHGGNSMIASLIIAALIIRVSRENTEAQIVSMVDKSHSQTDFKKR